jgi:gamma-glutamyltranspeptidase / glutathione hydrolase
MLAIIAGEGALPGVLYRHLAAQGEAPLVVELQGFPSEIKGVDPIRFRVEHLASLLIDLRARGVRQLCLAGRVQRPTLDADAVAEGLPASGWIAAEDLVAYRVAWRAPLVRWFRGRQVIGMPPPSSGGVALLQVLGILDGFPLAAEAATLPLPEVAGDEQAMAAGERLVHWWIEALRRAFAERASALGDPDHVAVPVEELLSAAWIARARISIGDRAEAGASPGLAPEGTHTTHLSVLDREGGAVALTTTLNSSFGSGILVRGGGFLLNNELDDFALGADLPKQFGLVGGAANAPAPGKRPLSSMSPTVVRDGRAVRLVLGSRGGPRIITAVAGVLLRNLVLDQPLELAVAAPRLHQQWSPPVTDVEPGWPEPLLEALRARGHDLRLREPWGAVQAIAVLPGGEVVGVSDPRSGGAAVGTQP